MNVWRLLVLYIINHFLSSTRFFEIKRALLNSAGLYIGVGTKVVGPIYFGSQIRVKIGEGSWVGRNFNIDGNGVVEIGSNVDIAPHVTINTGGHEIGTKVRRAGRGVTTRVVIEDGTWIGTNVLIVNNSVISAGCVIAAGSVVINDVPPNTLSAGAPAREKRRLST